MHASKLEKSGACIRRLTIQKVVGPKANAPMKPRRSPKKGIVI
jgi:hypothetical protein